MHNDLIIYLQLTRDFNAGRLWALLAGGQAVVLYRLAIMSKDGDWILREDEEALDHVLAVLAAHGARYRFGAPLALPWMRAGWSAHFEFPFEGLRVRTDFVTRPARLPAAAVSALWAGQEHHPPAPDEAKLAAEQLILTKQTNREKDYAAIGELARLLDDPRAIFSKLRPAIRTCCRPPRSTALASRRWRKVLKLWPPRWPPSGAVSWPATRSDWSVSSRRPVLGLRPGRLCPGKSRAGPCGRRMNVWSRQPTDVCPPPFRV